VPPIIRETVGAVADAATDEGISIRELAEILGIDKAAVSRRWNSARARGYLRNLETKRGRPAQIVLAEPLPEDLQILPTLEVLAERCGVDGVSGRDAILPPGAGIRAPVDGLSASFGQPDYLGYVAAVQRAGHITAREAFGLEQLHRATLRADRE
jgi:transcriptional regulator with XRE-family HTH domain